MRGGHRPKQSQLLVAMPMLLLLMVGGVIAMAAAVGAAGHSTAARLMASVGTGVPHSPLCK